MPRRKMSPEESALIERVRELCGVDEEFLTASHIEMRYGRPAADIRGFPPPMADGRRKTSEVDDWIEAITRDLLKGLAD